MSNDILCKLMLVGIFIIIFIICVVISMYIEIKDNKRYRMYINNIETDKILRSLIDKRNAACKAYVNADAADRELKKKIEKLLSLDNVFNLSKDEYDKLQIEIQALKEEWIKQNEKTLAAYSTYIDANKALDTYCNKHGLNI